MTDARDEFAAGRARARERLRAHGLGPEGWVPPNKRPAVTLATAEEVAPSIRVAWFGVAAFAVVVVAADGWFAVARSRPPFHGPGTFGGSLIGLTAVLAAVAVVLSGRPIRRATRFGASFMVPRVYMPGFMGLVPMFAPYVLVEAAIRLFANTAGGYVTAPSSIGVDGRVEGGIQLNAVGGGEHFPKVALPNGAGRPLGVTFLMLGTLWPVAVGLAMVGWQ